MPPGAHLAATSTPSASFKAPSPLSLSRPASSRPLSGGFAPYEVEDDDRAGGVSTPEPIRVTKVKKKRVCSFFLSRKTLMLHIADLSQSTKKKAAEEVA